MTRVAVRKCACKVRHETRAEADQAASGMRRHNQAAGVAGQVRVYRCELCEGFHVGRRGKGRRR